MKRGVVVGALGTAQTLAWGSSYYLPAILADPIADGLGVSRTVVFGVFSGSLLVSAFLGPSVGRVIDAHGGRAVLALSNLVLAAGLVLLALTQRRCEPRGRVGSPRHRDGDGSLRSCLRHPCRSLWPGGARADYRDYPDRRLRQHRRLAAVGVARSSFRLARGLPRLGGAASLDRLAVEPAADPTRAATHSHKSDRSAANRRTDASRSDAAARLCLCRDLVCHRGDGGPSAPTARNSRGKRDGGDCRSRLGRASASGSSPRRVWCAEADAPA